MIRMTLLIVFLLALWIYAFRDWMVSLCGLILLTMLTQNDDLPRSIAGIQGLNPWNLSLLIVTIAWVVKRPLEKKPWSMSPWPVFIVGGYLVVILFAYLRAAMDIGSFTSDHNRSLVSLTSDEVINPMKYLWVAFLLADGCRSRGRIKLAVGTILTLGLLYGLLVLKNINLVHLVDSSNMLGVRHRIDKVIGLHANDMAKVLGLTFWGIAVTFLLWRNWKYKAAAIAGGIISLLALAVCFSRSGYVTFVGVGCLLACVRWPRLFVLGPVALLVLCLLMPSIVDRALMGFGEHSVAGQSRNDWSVITAGRADHIWPPVIDEIKKRPIFGYGRLAILRTPAYAKIVALEGSCPASPHNGYLEVMLDTGLVGLSIVLAVFLGAAAISFRLMRSYKDPICLAVGSLGLVHAVGCLITAIPGTILFPDQGMLGTMCVFAMALRVWCGVKRPATAARRSPMYIQRPRLAPVVYGARVG